MSFNNVRLPEDVERGATGGAGFKTTILTLSSGFEQRNIDWERSRGRWDISYGLDQKDNLEAVLGIYYTSQGRAIGFRFKDWTDYEVGDNGTSTPQEIAVGDGAKTKFQSVRRYTAGSVNYDREITRIVSGTVRVFVSAVEQNDPADYSIDLDTGIITFTTAPTASFSIGLICEFDVPVRFDSDNLPLIAQREDVYSIPEVPIVELKERLGSLA